MSKRASKLDPHAERLTEMLLGKDEGGEGLTYEQAQEQLRLDGCEVSTQRLCDWWQSQQSDRLQDRLLKDIASGAQKLRDIESAFAENPAPEIPLLMKLLQHVIFHLTTQGKEKSENLELASNLTSKVLEFAKIGQKKEEIALNKQKFQWDAAGACLALLPELKAISSDKALNEAEKVEQIRLKLFGVIP